MSTGVTQYLEMQRSCYAELVEQSDFETEAFTTADDIERVVGSYAQHEAFDYERWLFGGLTLSRRAVALEYGCGPGRMLLRLAPLFNRVDGADISPEVLRVARRRTASLPAAPRLYAIDGQSLPRELDGTYDVAYSVICLQHIAVHAIRRAILHAIFRVLKPGGVLTFQMGYGPGHAGMVDYFEDRVDAPGTNGAADVTVLHPSELASDLVETGFVDASYALTPTGPGDTHAAWVFVRAMKPGPREALVSPDQQGWATRRFEPLVSDPLAVAAARHVHAAYSVVAHARRLNRRLDDVDGQVEMVAGRLAEHERAHAALLRERNAIDDAAALARGDRDAWRTRADALRTERDRLEMAVEALARQVRRLRIADRRRVGVLMNDVVRDAQAGRWRVGVFGAGEHTEWLFRETTLQTLRDVFLFDSNAANWGKTVGGITVRPVHDVPVMNLQAVVVSSLAFQDEMAGYIESLGLAHVQVIRCYP